MGVETIDLDKLYFPYKKDLEEYYEKYFGKDGNILNFKNFPLTIFARDYIMMGKEIFNILDDHVFIRYEYDRYSDSESVKYDTHKYNAAKRIMRMVDSIRKYGYCGGEFDHSRHMIRVCRGFVSPYGNDFYGYTLKTRKHRAAACIALGIKNVRVKI